MSFKKDKIMKDKPKRGRPKKKDSKKKDNKTNNRKVLSTYASMNAWWSRGQAVPTIISRPIIKKIARTSETVAAILEHASNDIAGAGYGFVKAENVDKPNMAQYGRAVNFFKQPNPDDQGDEWLYDFVYDFLLFGDAYWEKSGTLDVEELTADDKKCWFGGDLKAIWHVDASTMKILNTSPTGQMPDPESGEMAYEQKAGPGVVQLDTRSIARASRFRQGRLYGESPLLSLLNIIAGQINLTGYIGNLFKGNVPKHLLNLGDISEEEFDRLNLSMKEQMEQATNPFGMVAINSAEGFELQRLMETNKEGQFLETLEYYKSEICSVFGIPPAKLGIATAGRLGSPEEMLDSWYDKIEAIHDRLEKVINRSIMIDLGITDWKFKFNEVKPKKTRMESQTLKDNATGLRIYRQESICSINEAREIAGWKRIEAEWAEDPQYESPMAKNPGGLGTPHIEDEKFVDIEEILENLVMSMEEVKRRLEISEMKSKKDEKVNK